MIRVRNFLPLAATALVGAAVLGAPSQAHATMQLSWSVNSNLLGSDPTNTIIGSLVNNVAGGFTVTGSAVGTNSGAFGPNTAGMDLSTISITAAGPSTLTLYLTQNGLTSPLGPGLLTAAITGQFLAGSGTVSMVAYGNDTNLLYGNGATQSGTSPAIGPPNNVATPSFGLGSSGSVAFTATNPYSMTEIITINFTSSGTVSLSSDGKTTFSNPAPMGLVLFLSGSPLMGLAYLRRRKTTELAA
jgi:hypothetical protein